MEQAIIKEVIEVLIAAVVLYVGFINKMRTQIALLEDNIKDLQERCKEVTNAMTEQTHVNTVLEEKVKHMESRQDSHSKKNDEVITLITDFKIEMAKKIGDVSAQMGKIQSDVENINSTIAIFDSGIVSKKKKKGVK